jgi:DNA repair exonuclease SbcCD ATPase subunit
MSTSPQTCCPICLDILSAKPIGAVSPCGHVFHRECFDGWTASVSSRPSSSSKVKVKCPTCNQLSKHFLNIFLDFDKLHMGADDGDSDHDSDNDSKCIQNKSGQENTSQHREKISRLKTNNQYLKNEIDALKEMVVKAQESANRQQQAEENEKKAMQGESEARSEIQHVIYAKERLNREVNSLNAKIKELESDINEIRGKEKLYQARIQELEIRNQKAMQDARANRMSEVQIIIQRNSELVSKNKEYLDSIKTLTAEKERLDRCLQKGGFEQERATKRIQNASDVKAILKETRTQIDKLNKKSQEEVQSLKRKSEHNQMMSKMSSRASQLLALATKKQKRTVRPTFSGLQNLNDGTKPEFVAKSALARPHSSSVMKSTEMMRKGGNDIKRFFK